MRQLGSEIEVRLTMAEVIVLGNCLERAVTVAESARVLDEAEVNAFWTLEAALEKADVAAFSDTYASILEDAKTMLRTDG